MTFAATGVLSGTPAAATGGTYPITFTAQNGVGTNATQSFTLTVIQGQSSCTPVTPPSGTYFTDLTFSNFNVSANLYAYPECCAEPGLHHYGRYLHRNHSDWPARRESKLYGINPQWHGNHRDHVYVTNNSGSRYLDLAIFDQSYAHYGAIFGINPTTCSTTQSVFSDSGTSHWTLPAPPLKLGTSDRRRGHVVPNSNLGNS